MAAQRIDGNNISAELRQHVTAGVKTFTASTGRPPGLAVILVGDNPASKVYVQNKERHAIACGMRSFMHRLPVTATERDVLAVVSTLNDDPSIDGILLQLPLPRGIASQSILQSIDPAKDVDGFHPINIGRLAIGEPALAPCTPLGCMILARSALGELTGIEAVVMGRSNIVGKPMAQMLAAANATVTLVHSGTQDIASICRRADLLVVAVGHPEIVRGHWIKPGAIVIDVGINRRAATEKDKTLLVGDVCFPEAVKVAGAITPVPGGVGPMTIACLLSNTLVAAERRAGLSVSSQYDFKPKLVDATACSIPLRDKPKSTVNI